MPVEFQKYCKSRIIIIFIIITLIINEQTTTKKTENTKDRNIRITTVIQLYCIGKNNIWHYNNFISFLKL